MGAPGTPRLARFGGIRGALGVCVRLPGCTKCPLLRSLWGARVEPLCSLRFGAVGGWDGAWAALETFIAKWSWSCSDGKRRGRRISQVSACDPCLKQSGKERSAKVSFRRVLTLAGPPASRARLFAGPRRPVEPGKGGESNSLGVRLATGAGVGRKLQGLRARGSGAQELGVNLGFSGLASRELIPGVPRPEGIWGLASRSRRSRATTSWPRCSLGLPRAAHALQGAVGEWKGSGMGLRAQSPSVGC
ncbi:PREDICTED: uncharacterized protein LOC105553043 [Mandrillus leucophaeus]|uniref:uncharacterized protein LOC105553043 n=1 Tax=Mandrillus leucophaeus TaxID=9568 RepID=UPI0005F3FD13|nr:PREDICTED: uncharacterized protein LOC105553043 [Mandrillus leucophaeus]